ncbi:MAG: hypothetical protein ABGY71_00690 [bacterium]|jgi:hypothetical protein|nr:hypothetical protein [Planctomycetota bacterium]HIL51855.1 hypothetical protein [Planctomycetota bacterium]
MTSTARRRWSLDLESEIDGISFSESGPILVHGYDAPAGGMWVDEVIPGKLGALDRSTGEVLWHSPCEVGYGRGFGAGFGEGNDVIVVGPSSQGQRIVRMESATGKLIGVEGIGSFDEAQVFGDLCVCANASRVFAISSGEMTELWSFAEEGQRYHLVGRSGDRVLVVYGDKEDSMKGILALDACSGEYLGTLLPPVLPVIHGLAVDGDHLALLTADVQAALSSELAVQLMTSLISDDDGDLVVDNLTLLGLSLDDIGGAQTRWFNVLSTQTGSSSKLSEDLPEVSITADSQKLYIVNGALLEVRDLLSGRALGDWTIPGLDERVDWKVCQGAGLLAEEHRISVFELPA